jgi:hypothetical protein
MAQVNLNVFVISNILDINDRVRLSVYRLYINSELMSERTWIWGEHSNSISLKENIWVDLDINSTHTINLEQIFIQNDPNITIGISQFDILTHQFEILNSDSNSITFRIV